MDLGGPVWHVSIAGSTHLITLALEAGRQLAGVGDHRLGEWEHRTGQAFHVRRRLSAAEQERTGLTVEDIRRTPEAHRRAAALGARLRLAPAEVLLDELGIGG